METIYSSKFIEKGTKKDKNFSEKISSIRVERLGLPDHFIEHGECSILYQRLGLDPESIAAKAKLLIERRRSGGMQMLNKNSVKVSAS
jgi:deoxyxylulose-5-phosphate synthase